jgi:pantoate--beta-alanine ligase
MSVFVNPTQFGPNEDFARYPRPFEQDCRLAGEHGCSVLFAPPPEEMYPKDYMTYVNVEDITTKLEGGLRPGHFKGVTTVVLKFFNIVAPQVAFFGQKDAQQVVVIKRMVKDLNVPIELQIVPTVREADGLAMSSRNVYLSSRERSQAPLIYRGLRTALEAFGAGERSAEKLTDAITAIYRQADCLEVQYIAIVDTLTLEPLAEIRDKALIAVACRMSESKTRLIDNVVLGGSL